jgi:hypothetical protein
MDGFVYLIGELDNKDIYKIGVTKKDINKRIKELQTGSSDELYVRHSFKTSYPYKLEKMLHRHFSHNNKLNEWFTLSENQAKDFLNVCEYYETILDSLKDNPFFNNKKSTII